MSEHPQEKSNKRVLVLANYDLGLYQFRGDLLKALISEGCEVYISLPDGEWIERMTAFGCRFINTPLERRGMNPLKDAALLFRYRRIIAKVRPELVITYTIKPNIYGALVCRMTHTPCCVNITGLGGVFDKGGLLKRFVLAMYKPALKKALCVFFENAQNCKDLMKTGVVPDGKAHVLHGAGVSLECFPFVEYPADNKTVRFLFAGRIMKEKGVDELFEAARRLRSEYGDSVKVAMAGPFEDSYKQTVDELCREKIIEYLGYADDMAALYADAHCVVLPSYHEGMSNVLLEGAATGRPLITSNIHGCLEAVDDGENGFLCEVRSSEALYEAMKRFVETPYEKKKAMGAHSRTVAERDFDKKKVVGETLAVIKKALGQ